MATEANSQTIRPAVESSTLGVRGDWLAGIEETRDGRIGIAFQDTMSDRRKSFDHPGTSDSQESGLCQDASDTASDSEFSQWSVATCSTQLTSRSTSVATDDRISRCPLCESKFSGTYQDRKSNLSQHLRCIHEPKNRYKCTISGCDQEYTRPENLIKHHHMRHSEVPLNSAMIRDLETGNIESLMKNDGVQDRQASLDLSGYWRPTTLNRQSAAIPTNLWLNCANLYKRHVVREASIPPGKTRIRWTCVSHHCVPLAVVASAHHITEMWTVVV